MEILGRTNRAFPRVWLSLSIPHQPEDGWAEPLTEAAISSGAPLDVTSQPALWGHSLREAPNDIIVIAGGEMETATDERHAIDLVQAGLIQRLSALGRETLDVYFLRVRRGVEEFQISGALEALESARQEGHIRHVGLCADGSSLAALGLWQFHDAFEALLVPRNPLETESYATLAPLAHERRVGIVTYRPLAWRAGVPITEVDRLWRLRNLTQSFYGITLAQAAVAHAAQDHPVLVGVRSASEVMQAIEAPSKPLPNGLGALFDEFAAAYRNVGMWRELSASPHEHIRKAAEGVLARA